MPLDQKSLQQGSPRALDGRGYPPYLRAFERYDIELLGRVSELDEPTLNQIVQATPSAKMRSAVSPWIASAEWRDLVERVVVDELAGKRRYRLTERGRELLSQG
jgi:hypothetical protein